MRIQMQFNMSAPLSLPLSYHHILQGFIYCLLSSTPEYSTFIHESGFDATTRKYKLFTFSLIQGRYKIKEKLIVFDSPISFEIRSVDPNFSQSILERLSKQSKYVLNGQEIYLTRYEKSQANILSSQVRIKTCSPITIHRTLEEEGNKKTIYLSPLHEHFNSMINENFHRKYRSYYGVSPDTDISITPYRISARDRYITSFKGILITAWKGIYNLEGSSNAINFLYDTGIGDRNSQGFGAFELL